MTARFRHLDYDPETPVHDLGPAALDALLERGDLEDWAPLLRAVAEDPWGATAETVLRLCEAHPLYGTSALWRTWIGQRRVEDERGESLAEVRRRAGLTQVDVSARMGISQSDVSKLERRGDVRVSTLRAYARALGGRLRLHLRLPGDPEPVVLRLAEARQDEPERAVERKLLSVREAAAFAHPTADPEQMEAEIARADRDESE